MSRIDLLVLFDCDRNRRFLILIHKIVNKQWDKEINRLFRKSFKMVLSIVLYIELAMYIISDYLKIEIEFGLIVGFLATILTTILIFQITPFLMILLLVNRRHEFAVELCTHSTVLKNV